MAHAYDNHGHVIPSHADEEWTAEECYAELDTAYEIPLEDKHEYNLAFHTAQWQYAVGNSFVKMGKGKQFSVKTFTLNSV